MWNMQFINLPPSLSDSTPLLSLASQEHGEGASLCPKLEREREREREREGRCGVSQLQQAENSGSSRSSGCRSLLFSQNVLLSSPANQRSRSPGDPLHAPFLQGNTNWRGRQTLSVCATELLSLLLLGFLFLPTEWILLDSGSHGTWGQGCKDSVPVFMEVVFTALWNLDRLRPNDRRREVDVLLGDRYTAISISTLMDASGMWRFQTGCLYKVALQLFYNLG